MTTPVPAGSRRLRRTAALAFSAMVVCAALSGCGDDSAPSVAATTSEPGAKLKGDYGGKDYGSLVDAYLLTDRSIELRDAASLTARITYISVLGTNNNLLPTTATLFVPRGPAPQKGWTTVALGHPTTGIDRLCAPSRSRDLLGLSSTVVGFLRAGFAVTVPDYQGLGGGDVKHPYLDSTTVGFNLIDSVRAARKVVPELSAQWAAVGVDQGGQAAWAANELATNFGGGLTFLGSISVAPFADVQGLADAAAAGTLTAAQKWMYVAYLNSLENAFGTDFNLDDYRRGGAQQKWDDVLACDGRQPEQFYGEAAELSPDDLRPASADAVEVLRGFLRKTTLPQGVTAKPMWVIYGEQDPLMPPAWTDIALDRACGYGDVIQIERQPGHPVLVDVPRAVEWINARVAGTPPINDCATRGAPPAGGEPTPTESAEPGETPTESAEPSETPTGTAPGATP